MGIVHLALLWHQHQPSYVDASAMKASLPWVRLHGIKDYYGMAAVAEEFPRVRMTINLVPGMLEQLEWCVEGKVTDPWMEHRDARAEDLSDDQRRFILERFFMASWDRMIRPVPRYRELLERRAFSRKTAQQASREFSAPDIRDLQVLANLVWFHPLAVARDERLRALWSKGSGFSDDDKRTLAACERDVLARIIPLHRSLEERGQVELTASPYCHPIVPLLCNMERARDAMPDVSLPRRRMDLSGDAREQIRLAMESHERRFGRRPRGMWPSEGSVSPETVELAAEAGVRWLATDEEVLSACLQSPVRDPQGLPTERLYRPYRAESGGRSLGMVFRDHALSDSIGFRYQSWDSARAAEDFVARVAAAKATPGGGPVFVPVILDGENCWEHYSNQGLDFLRSLYAGLEQCRDVLTVRIGDFVEEHPPTETLPRIFSGSWINRNFHIWIGHDDDVRAWEMLFRTREALRRAEGGLSADARGRALAAMYAAEGSDWFWWFGEDHSSGMDEEFDRLFRTHLANVYRFSGSTPPEFLSESVMRVQAKPAGEAPTAFLAVQVDGRPTHYFEWLAAGRASAGVSGAMSRSGERAIEDVYFGFDRERIFWRIDLSSARPASRHAAERREAAKSAGLALGAGSGCLAAGESLRIILTEPRTVTVDVPRTAPRDQGRLRVTDENGGASDGVGLVVADVIIELYAPMAALGVSPGDTMKFKVQLLSGGDVVESLPEAGTIPMALPTEEYEKTLWRA